LLSHIPWAKDENIKRYCRIALISQLGLMANSRCFPVDQNSSAFVADRILIQALEKSSRPITCEQDTVLFRQGEVANGIYILQSGEAALVMTSESGEVLARLHAGKGSLLGLPGIVGEEPYSLAAIARAGSKVAFVKREDFEEMLRSEPPLSLKVCEVLAAEVRAARRALAEL
jgi:CRP-like cAMP-binding protein